MSHNKLFIMNVRVKPPLGFVSLLIDIISSKKKKTLGFSVTLKPFQVKKNVLMN